MNDSVFEFVPGVFWKVLAATLTVVMLGWIGAMWIFGELKTVDIVGSLISAPILAYMVHLWIVYGKKLWTNWMLCKEARFVGGN